MNKFQILKRLFNDYTKKYIKKITISFIFTIILALSTSSVAYLLDPAIKELFIEKDKNKIYLIPSLIILAFTIKAVSLYIAKVLMINVSEEVRKNIQTDMFNSLINADTELIDNKHSGTFVTNLTNDVSAITTLVSTSMLNLFKDTFTLIGLLLVMFYQNWLLSLVAIIMIPLASIAAKTLGKRMGKASVIQMNRVGELTSYLIEIFKNHKLTKIFQQEKFEVLRSNDFLEEYKKSNRKIATLFVRASPIMEILTGIMIALLIFVSAKLIEKNELEVSNFFSFLAAMMLAYQPVRSLATLNMSVSAGLAASNRVLPIIDNKPKISENLNKDKLKIKGAEIIFNKVNFKYSQKDESCVLKNLNLFIPGKKMTALVGHSGAGKSTILNLIPRLYELSSGEIKIDNQDIKEINLYSLRKNLSMVSQDTTLFDDTIKNNIAYAKPSASDNEIEEAARYSYAGDFIDKLPEKFETIIGENGLRLSGGEKQRLSIARALLKKTPIILLDEATSSLDAETEDKIQKAISFLTKGRTTIVIAHRLSTILNADKIYVIDKGAVAGEGTHDDLIRSSKIYKNFYIKQIQKS